MKSKTLGWTLRIITAFVLGSGIVAMAQVSTFDKFSGAINAYSPQTSSTGPYEVHGTWNLKLKRDSRKADFSAALNMQLSDGWVLTKNSGNFDPNTRDHHTHHITLVDADVTWLTNGFRVTGSASVTSNGSPAPISPTPLQIDVTGGSTVEFSNITLTFSPPGSNHFGTAALPGVVRSVKR